jgi:DNA-binding transcriptional LysR family regulator
MAQDLCDYRKGMNLNRITTFVRVAESGSFSAAARTLELPTSSVSRAVAALEDDLSVRLFHRTTRKLTLTDAGQHYFATVRGALGQIEEANAAASDASQAPRGTVRITAPADMASLFFMHVIARFVAQYPQVHVDIVFANRRVNLIDENIDLALRAGPLDDSSAMAKRVGSTELALYAARSYVEQRGQPRTLAQLAQHSCIVLRGNAGVIPWRLAGPRGVEEIRVHGSVTVDGMAASRAAVNAGLGIGLLPTVSLPGESDGDVEVVRILPRYANPGGPLSLVWTSSRFLPKHVALLRDHLAEELTKIMARSPRRG